MHELAKLNWQCRRGTKELDLLLKSYLEKGYLLADKEEQGLFIDLLGFEDDRLIGVLLGELEEQGMEGLVGKMRAFVVGEVFG